MTERQISSNPPVHIRLRRSVRARRYSLRVSRQDGQVTLTLPRSASENDALAFAREKLGWILQAQEAVHPGKQVGLGVDLPVGGRLARVSAADIRVPRLENGGLLVPRRGDPGRVIAAWMRTRAHSYFAATSQSYAQKLGREVRALSIRDTRSRWGSCSAQGRLMFSWRLMMAPVEVADYVAAHEVAHLVEMNHSAAFWATVAQLMPDYEARRGWLRHHGSDLQSWRFGSTT